MAGAGSAADTDVSPPFTLVEPDRLQIREGGGCMSAFGLPFFGAGIFLFLTLVGIVPVSNAGELPTLAWPLLVLMAIAFTAVGAGLVFGRSWTIVDRARREVIKQWGLLVPLHTRTVALDMYHAVRLGFVEGDSDTADKFPVALKAQNGRDLVLWNATVYGQARDCARALSVLLHFELEDASTDHPVRLPVNQIDVPFRERVRRDGGLSDDVTRPAGARSQVNRELGTVTIVVPARPKHALLLAAAAIPIGIVFVIGPALAAFFRRSNTPEPVGWAFLGFLTLFFGIVPTFTIVGAYLRSRRGATIVEISKQGLRLYERGVWKTRPIASLDASDILDIDYSSQESTLASAKRAAEQQVLESYPSAAEATHPRVERIVAALTRFAKGKGVTVKTRQGLTTFGQGLDDEEIRYLYSLVRRALIE
jgi:hypothetical protein